MFTKSTTAWRSDGRYDAVYRMHSFTCLAVWPSRLLLFPTMYGLIMIQTTEVRKRPFFSAEHLIFCLFLVYYDVSNFSDWYSLNWWIVNKYINCQNYKIVFAAFSSCIIFLYHAHFQCVLSFLSLLLSWKVLV